MAYKGTGYGIDVGFCPTGRARLSGPRYARPRLGAGGAIPRPAGFGPIPGAPGSPDGRGAPR